jgi:DNA-binding response OmpR family regulator
MANLLLVDDDYDILTMGRAILASAEHNVWTADGALAALDMIRSTPIDLIITDANMKPYSGYELLRTIRTERDIRHLPVAMLTSRRDRKDIDRAIELGVTDYIIKPLVPEVFLRKVNELVHKFGTQNKDAMKTIELATSGRAEIIVGCTITSVSEIGIVIVNENSILPGTQMKIDCPLFRELGIAAPLARVLSSVQKESSFESRLQFIGLEEKYINRLKTWIHAEVQSHRKAA